MSTKSDLEARVSILESQVRMILLELGNEAKDRDIVAAFAKMTPRMHGALQCIVAGVGNREIADRFGVQESTAKVYVRGVAAKLGVRTRAEIVAKVLGTMKAMSPDEYLKLTGIDRFWFESGEMWRDRDGESAGVDEG